MNAPLPQPPNPVPNSSPPPAPSRPNKPRRSWRSPRMLALAGALLIILIAGTGIAWRWWSSARIKAEIITATVIRGDLPITVTERGELDSLKSVEVRCEVEGKDGVKRVSTEPEGVHVSAGQEVARYDTDAIKNSYDQQEIKFKTADGNARSFKAELEVQENKQKSDVAKADLAAQVALLDLEKYEKAEYDADYFERKGAIDLAQKELDEAKSDLKFSERMVTRGLTQLEQHRAKENLVNNKDYVLKQNQAKLKVLEFDRRKKITEFKFKATDAQL